MRNIEARDWIMLGVCIGLLVVPELHIMCLFGFIMVDVQTSTVLKTRKHAAVNGSVADGPGHHWIRSNSSTVAAGRTSRLAS